MHSSTKATFTQKQVEHVADLAHIPVTTNEAKQLAQDFSTTLDVISDLEKVDVAGIEPTHQVTGLSNVTREDTVDESRMFTQAQALANAPKQHDGFFVVPRIIDREA